MNVSPAEDMSSGGADLRFRLARIEAFAFRCPIPAPLETSFGVMRDRPAAFVRVEDAEGCFGWGEVFANWPAAGAEHRARLLIEDIAPLALGRAFASPAEMLAFLTARTHVRALQCGEPGPFRQCLAGLDIAAVDLLARRAGLGAAALLDPRAAPETVPTYASGVHVDDGARLAGRLRETGFRTVKLKVGFGAARDLAGVRAASGALAGDQRLALDANQAWSLETAAGMMADLAAFDPLWMEEPIVADCPPEAWTQLARLGLMPLAGGENVAGDAAFDAAIALGALQVLQPDLAKWGGFTGCLRVGRAALAAGRRFCPHFLGGGIGLIASAHLLAAAGGDGLLELDANPNPLRDAFIEGRLRPDGSFRIAGDVGLGIERLPDGIARYRTHAAST